MTVAEATVDVLLSLAPVTALVSTRIYRLRLPQTPTLPAIRVQLISPIEDFHLRGPNGLKRARVQVDSVGRSGHEAETVDVAVHGDGISTGLSGWRGTLGSPSLDIVAIFPITAREDYDALELKQYKVMRDYWIWFREVT